MGSINDLYVGEMGKIGMWKDNTFDILKSISWTFATTNKIQFLKTNISNIEGVVCRDCSYSEISEIGIERYISKKHLPTIIPNILPTDYFLDLLNFEYENYFNSSTIKIENSRVLQFFTGSASLREPVSDYVPIWIEFLVN